MLKLILLLFISSMAYAEDCYHFHQWTICENEHVVCWVDRTIGMDSLHCEHKNGGEFENTESNQ